jgi:hypothetical protein
MVIYPAKATNNPHGLRVRLTIGIWGKSQSKVWHSVAWHGMAGHGMTWNGTVGRVHRTSDEDTMHCCDLMRLRWRGIKWNGDRQSIVEQMAHPHVRVVLRRIQSYTDPSLVAHTTTGSFVRTEKNGSQSQNDADSDGDMQLLYVGVVVVAVVTMLSTTSAQVVTW